jgi:hypothetical protein
MTNFLLKQPLSRQLPVTLSNPGIHVSPDHTAELWADSIERPYDTCRGVVHCLRGPKIETLQVTNPAKRFSRPVHADIPEYYILTTDTKMMTFFVEVCGEDQIIEDLPQHLFAAIIEPSTETIVLE